MLIQGYYYISVKQVIIVKLCVTDCFCVGLMNMNTVTGTV